MKLARQLGLLDVFCIASGAMISSGLFVLPGLAYVQGGPGIFISYILAGLLAMTGMFSQAELASAMPKAGGDVFYVTRSMGPAVGTVDGLIIWFSMSLKTAFALVGMAAFFSLIFNLDPHTGTSRILFQAIAVALCLLFVGINLLGVKEAGRVQVVLVVGLLVVLIWFIIQGMPHVDVDNLRDFAPHGAAGILSTAGLVFISFGGLLNIASVAEEVKNPGKVIPHGMALSLGIVTLLYALSVFVTTGVLGDKLGTSLTDYSLTPISDCAAEFMGTPGRIALGVAAILAFISTANAGIMAASRYPLALSRDDMLPKTLAKISPRFHTPHIAIFLTGGFIILFLFLQLQMLVKTASSVLILTFLFSHLSVLILRESHIQNYRPSYKHGLYPWVQIIGAGGCLALLIQMGLSILWGLLIFISSGFFVYWFYGRIKTTRDYALLHLVERITARELTSELLEDELKGILRERDEIVTDRLDHIIENCDVVDLEEAVDLNTLFQHIARALSGSTGTEPDELHDLLVKREQESDTAISPDVAIPHILLAGEQHFQILLARCREGIHFSETAPSVKAVFVLAGTRDDRNFHLRTLAAIAQIVQDAHFLPRWIAARDQQGLRDIVLLGKRQRL